jgi:hypothetical protein
LQGNKEEVCRLGIKAGEIEARVGREVDDEVTRLQRAAEGYKRDVAGILGARLQAIADRDDAGTEQQNNNLKVRLIQLWKEQPSIFKGFFEVEPLVVGHDSSSATSAAQAAAVDSSSNASSVSSGAPSPATGGELNPKARLGLTEEVKGVLNQLKRLPNENLGSTASSEDYEIIKEWYVWSRGPHEDLTEIALQGDYYENH